jgi:glutaredoxin 3
MNITIYSTTTCPHCLLAKRYFDENNIKYTNFDVSEDQKKAEEMIELSGQMGVPVIKIDDKVIVGFDRREIEKIINK